MKNELTLPSWSHKLFIPEKYRYKVIYGGRGSGKTYSVVLAIIWLVLKRPLRVLILREHKSSLERSAHTVLKDWIHELGLNKKFKFIGDDIKGSNGSEIFFHGFSNRNADSIPGLEKIDIVWFEEGDKVTEYAWNLIYPTIRKDMSEIWITFNPKRRTDTFWKLFVIDDNERAWVQKVNWQDNQYFPKTLREDMEYDKKHKPEIYSHIWEGEPLDEGEGRPVLPYRIISACVDAHKELDIHQDLLYGSKHSGFDIAADGSNLNAVACRTGPLINRVESWHGISSTDTAKRAHEINIEEDIHRMYYDAGGIGSNIREFLSTLEGREKYTAEPILFGGKVSGPEIKFMYEFSNRQYFHRRKDQLYWTLRLRAERTYQMLESKEGDPSKCLFIDGEIKNINSYVAELTQAEYNDRDGPVRVNKHGSSSGNVDRLDATALSFADDSRNGLRNR